MHRQKRQALHPDAADPHHMNAARRAKIDLPLQMTKRICLRHRSSFLCFSFTKQPRKVFNCKKEFKFSLSIFSITVTNWCYNNNIQ
jgi:hypothetical protein